MNPMTLAARDMDITAWKGWKANGGRRVTFVGALGNARVQGILLTVSKSGVRVRVDGGRVELFHPSDVRTGWI